MKGRGTAKIIERTKLSGLFRSRLGGNGFDEAVELFNQGVHFHAVHQSPIFQRVKLNRKTTATTHMHVIKEFDRLRVGADDFVDGGLLLDDHI